MKKAINKWWFSVYGRLTKVVLNEIPFQKRQNCVLLSKSFDDEQDY